MKIPGGFRRDHYLLSKGQRFWDARSLRVPVLYMRGARDHWSRAQDLDALERDLPAMPNSKFVTIPDATHFVFLDRPERGRTQMLDEIRDFIRALAAAGRPLPCAAMPGDPLSLTAPGGAQ